MLSIRPAIASDLDQIGTVHVRAWRDSYAGILPAGPLAALDPARKAEGWRALLEPGDTILLVAQEGPRILGFGSAGAQRTGMLRRLGYLGEVSALYLLREAQGRGLGRALMGGLARGLSDWGYEAMALWVLTPNRPARAFYDRLGGVELHERDDSWAGMALRETAYGWRDLSVLMGPRPPG
jgi:GNAT superfamily N-acetyltransferase